jgi:hypothetical protein
MTVDANKIPPIHHRSEGIFRLSVIRSSSRTPRRAHPLFVAQTLLSVLRLEGTNTPVYPELRRICALTPWQNSSRLCLPHPTKTRAVLSEAKDLSTKLHSNRSATSPVDTRSNRVARFYTRPTKTYFVCSHCTLQPVRKLPAAALRCASRLCCNVHVTNAI